MLSIVFGGCWEWEHTGVKDAESHFETNFTASLKKIYVAMIACMQCMHKAARVNLRRHQKPSALLSTARGNGPAGPHQTFTQVLTRHDGVFANAAPDTIIIDCSTIGIEHAKKIHDAAR